MIPTLLAFDIGTSGNKAVLVDSRSGGLIAAATAAYPTIYTADGGAEQAPDAWWASVVRCCAQLRAEAPVAFDGTAAVGCSGIMNGVVLVDKSGNALRNAIIHADVRAARQCARLESQLGVERIHRLTSNRLTPHVSLPKLMRLQETEPEIVNKARWAIQAKDYAAGRLTGVFGFTDPSDASLTGAFNLVERRWSDELWAASGLKRDLRPGIRASTAVLGTICDAAAEATGLKKGIPVVMGGGDGACSSAGSGAAVAQPYICLGGTSWIGLIRHDPLDDLRLSSYCCLDDRVTTYGTVQAAGSAVEWIARLLGDGPESIERLENLGESALSDDLYFLPYLQGERAPLWDPAARGVFLGLATHHGKGDVYRAVIDGVSCALRSVLDVFSEHGAIGDELRVIGGGARSALLRRALAAAACRRLGMVVEQVSATSMGAAMAAGVGAGLYASIEEAAGKIEIKEREEPEPLSVDRYERYYNRWSRIYPAVKGLF